MSASSSLQSLTLSETRFQNVRDDIEAVKRKLKSVRESPYITVKGFKSIRVGIDNFYKRVFDIGRFIRWEWRGSTPTTEPEWKEYWDDFLIVADLTLTAEKGKRLPIEDLIPNIKSDLPEDAHEELHTARIKQLTEESRELRSQLKKSIRGCVDEWDAFRARYGAQIGHRNDNSRSSSSSSSATDTDKSESITDYGTAVIRPRLNPPSLHGVYAPTYGRPRYHPSVIVPYPGHGRRQTLLEARRRRNPAEYLPGEYRQATRPHSMTQTSVPRAGFFSDATRLRRSYTGYSISENSTHPSTTTVERY